MCLMRIGLNFFAFQGQQLTCLNSSPPWLINAMLGIGQRAIGMTS